MAQEKKEPQTKVSIEAQIEAMEAKIKDAEAKALERVCKAMGINLQQVEQAEAAKTKRDELMHYDIGSIVVHINGDTYTGQGIAPAGVVEAILHMAGAKRMRELRAKLGNNYQISVLAGGAISSRVVGKSEESLV